jgi:hypothetical protein
MPRSENFTVSTALIENFLSYDEVFTRYDIWKASEQYEPTEI